MDLKPGRTMRNRLLTQMRTYKLDQHAYSLALLDHAFSIGEIVCVCADAYANACLVYAVD